MAVFSRYLIKNMRRGAATNALFCLLLTLSGALFSLSAGLWVSIENTDRNLEDAITTIAIPDVHGINRYARTLLESGRLMEYTLPSGETLTPAHPGWSSFAHPARIVSDLMKDIEENVYESGWVWMDDRRVYGAYVQGFRSVPFRITQEGTSDFFVARSPQSVAAFIATCVKVDEVFELALPNLIRVTVAEFRVEQDIHLHHGRFQTQTLTCYFPYMNTEGSSPVEVGKRYILMGYDYAQGDKEPYWYLNFPRMRMPNSLRMDVMGSNNELIRSGMIHSARELDHELFSFLLSMSADNYPIAVYSRVPAFDPTLGFEGLTWFEIEGSLEEALSSAQGENIATALSVAGISHNSLMVLTTNDLNSILRFNQRTNTIVEGRSFNERDVARGARVCVVSRQLAELNSLAVGDMLPLQLYPTGLGTLSVGDYPGWIPSPYHPSLGLTEPIEYEIVGIYSGLTQEMRDHSVTANMVIIPATSFIGLDNEPVERLTRNYSPPLLNTIIVPNGGIEGAMEDIERAAEGYGMFFRFYDQGYSTLKTVLANLRFGLTWIAVLAAIGWVVAVMLFSFFYLGRKKKEMALLYGLGVSRGYSSIWVFTQCAAVIIVAQGISLTAMLPVYGDILGTAVDASRTFTDMYRNFALSDMNIAGGIRFPLPLDVSPLGLIVVSVGQLVVLLATSMILSMRAAKQRWSLRSSD
jgi:hypothetical protein